MWICMEWHGARLYSVHRTRRESSSFMWNQPCQRCKYTTSVDSQKTRYTKLFTLVESHASAVSLLERGWCGFKCRKMSVWHLRNNAARERRIVLQKNDQQQTSVTCSHTPATHRCQQCQHQSRAVTRLQHTAVNSANISYVQSHACNTPLSTVPTSVTCSHTPATHRCQQCQHQLRAVTRLQHTAVNSANISHVESHACNTPPAMQHQSYIYIYTNLNV